jgi:hypothetical protein
MRVFAQLFATSLLACFCAPAILAQTNPPPADAHEMVTRQPRTLSKPAERYEALDLLERARQNYNLHDIMTPYSLKVSFSTSGTSEFEGEGTMDEVANEAQSQWRWVAQMGDSLIIRIGTDGKAYGTDASEPVPLRVQMLRAALHWPVKRAPGSDVIRARDVDRDGKSYRCLLLSMGVPPNPAPRSWYDNEYCVDPVTGILQTWSVAPGIFAVYDYTGAEAFHGHSLPRQISIFEEGRLALHAQVESIEDLKEVDENLFKPTPEMADAGGSFILKGPDRFPMRVDPSDGPTSTFFQPVIVHAILDAQDGRVLDAEALQTTDADLSRAATDIVRGATFEGTGFQREVFINVQFHVPAVEEGGPPVFHSDGVRWVIFDRVRKTAPRKISRIGN